MEQQQQQTKPRAEVIKTLQTARPELFDNVNGDFYGNNRVVVEDVVAIVCDGKRYRPRGGTGGVRTQAFRIPEDMSTGIAMSCFGVDAYLIT